MGRRAPAQLIILSALVRSPKLRTMYIAELLTSALPSAKSPIRIDANGRSGACDAAAYYHPFQRRIGRMRDFFRKSLAPWSQIRKTKGLAGKESRLEVYVSEELSLRVREENRVCKNRSP